MILTLTWHIRTTPTHAHGCTDLDFLSTSDSSSAAAAAAAAASRFVLEGPTKAELAKTPICLMIQPPLLGGLSNSFGVYNAALIYAARTGNVRVIVPEFVVRDAHSQSQRREDLAAR